MMYSAKMAVSILDYLMAFMVLIVAIKHGTEDKINLAYPFMMFLFAINAILLWR